MKSPYFYIIKHLTTNKYYAGCKINKKADSSNLMKEGGYQTTSKIIKNLIKKDGLESFVILKVKHFETKSEALDYESRFLMKVNAATNEIFLNRHNGGKNFVNKGGYKLPENTKEKMRKPKSKETIEKQNKAKRERSPEIYERMVKTRKENHPTWHNKDMIEKIKIHNMIWWNEENRSKHSSTMKQYYSDNPVSEETRKKISDSNCGKNNKMFGKKHSDATKEKMRLAWEKRRLKK